MMTLSHSSGSFERFVTQKAGSSADHCSPRFKKAPALVGSSVTKFHQFARARYYRIAHRLSPSQAFPLGLDPSAIANNLCVCTSQNSVGPRPKVDVKSLARGRVMGGDRARRWVSSKDRRMRLKAWPFELGMRDARLPSFVPSFFRLDRHL